MSVSDGVGQGMGFGCGCLLLLLGLIAGGACIIGMYASWVSSLYH